MNEQVVLILTVGMRDVCLSKEYETDYGNTAFELKPWNKLITIKFPRIGGGIIKNDLTFYSKYLEFPLSEPAFKYILREHKIDKVFFVVTNQPESVEHYRKTDTLHFAPIIEFGMKKAYPQLADTEFETNTVEGDVMKYDEMYKKFEVSNESFLNLPKNTKVYVQFQGGIDSINSPLLLRCIERYPNIIHLSKSESSKDSEQLRFPNLFVQNLTKHKVISAFKKFDYSAIMPAVSDSF